MNDDDALLLESQLCFAVVTAARNIVSIYRPVLDPLGLTHPQYLVMLALWERAPRSLSEIADALAVESATVSPIIKRLEAQGRVTRRRRADDERVLEITLTEDGAALRDRALTVPGQVLARVGMSQDDAARLRDGLAPFAGSQGRESPES
ncbi:MULTISPECIES: MarR family winged helix-turn-helix transcriptional regulator [unclassified Microbacterium]|uniref:MarR family winged helix-turn-helix transcriptional regulator n=1 Tax=unclassified Microbacterium TaxID=2609290 RepID=UPI00386D5030